MTAVNPIVVSFETDPANAGLARLQKSLTKWGWPSVVCHGDYKWRGFGHKFKAVAAACRTAAEAGYSHAISIDARDSLCVGPVADFRPPPQPLTFSCERNCWPDVARADSHPPCSHPWRFTHSPFVVDLSRCDLLAADNLRDHDDDQRHATNLVLSGNPEIGLDQDCRYTQSVAFCCLPCSDPLERFEIVGDRIRNRLTGSWPLFLHFNGKTDDSWVGPLI